MKLNSQKELIRLQILVMVNYINQMYEMVLDCFSDDNENLKLRVINLDNDVNLCEEMINNLVGESIALLTPVASDLRMIIASIKIASDLERIGDYAKSIVKYLHNYSNVSENIIIKIKEMIDAFLVMFDHTIDAYSRLDMEWALAIPEEDNQINNIYNELIYELKENINSHNIEQIFTFIAMIRNLERAGDHLKNICEHIIYQISGRYFDFH